MNDTKSEGCASAVKRILGKIDGVSDVQTNVEAKTVVVTADDSVSPQVMLEKLQKWSAASGKSVELAWVGGICAVLEVAGIDAYVWCCMLNVHVEM